MKNTLIETLNNIYSQYCVFTLPVHYILKPRSLKMVLCKGKYCWCETKNWVIRWLSSPVSKSQDYIELRQNAPSTVIIWTEPSSQGQPTQNIQIFFQTFYAKYGSRSPQKSNIKQCPSKYRRQWSFFYNSAENAQVNSLDLFFVTCYTHTHTYI